MMYLKTYKLFESIKNTKNTKFFIKKFLLDIKKSIGLKKSDFIFDSDNPIYFKLILFSKDEKLIYRLLKKYEKVFLDEGVVMSYCQSKENDIDLTDNLDIKALDTYTFRYTIYYKDLYTSRIKPNKFVYHFSNKKNRESILENGIFPTPHSGGNWENDKKLKYPDAIFAVNSSEKWNDGDIWEIDTEKINNKWWSDLNFFNRKELIMTFEKIDPSAIRLSSPIS